MKTVLCFLVRKGYQGPTEITANHANGFDLYGFQLDGSTTGASDTITFTGNEAYSNSAGKYFFGTPPAITTNLVRINNLGDSGDLTASLGGSSLAAGTCTSGTVTVAGAALGMQVIVTPTTYPGDAFAWRGRVTSPGTVTVQICNYSPAAATPTSSTYSVRVTQ